MNRTERERAALDAATCCMKAKRHIALVDVFLEMGKLSRKNHEDWRMGRVPYLERVIELNLSQINSVCRAIHESARRGKLKPNWTAYVKWGKGERPPLRFTKSGDPYLERQWATHYLPPALKTTVVASQNRTLPPLDTGDQTDESEVPF
ncbi:MAG: hypothetical protein EXS31_15790 [Pedosphaera sp.]|nr:hypothetical protein [Pedosphaera sp.]